MAGALLPPVNEGAGTLQNCEIDKSATGQGSCTRLACRSVLLEIQKANFNWNRITLPPPSANSGARKRPAGEVNTFAEIVRDGNAFGGFTNALALSVPNCGWLKILKNSVLNSSFMLSLIVTDFRMLKLKLLIPGVLKVLRPRLPVRPEFAAMPMNWAVRGSIGAFAASGFT